MRLYNATTKQFVDVPDLPALSPTDLARIAQEAADIAALTHTRQQQRVLDLIALNPANIPTFLETRYALPAANLAEANVALAKFQDDIITLAIAVNALGRRTLR